MQAWKHKLQVYSLSINPKSDFASLQKETGPQDQRGLIKWTNQWLKHTNYQPCPLNDSKNWWTQQKVTKAFKMAPDFKRFDICIFSLPNSLYYSIKSLELIYILTRGEILPSSEDLIEFWLWKSKKIQKTRLQACPSTMLIIINIEVLQHRTVLTITICLLAP